MPRAQPAKPTKLAKPPIKPPIKRDGTPSRPMLIEQARSRGKDTSLEGNAEAIDPNKPPTEKQRLFALHWASGETISTAAARAGYEGCPTYGYRLARQPNILAIYNAEKAKYEEAAQMTRKKVMDGLLEGIEMAKLAGEPASVISGWREIGKMCGYYEPVVRRIELSVEGKNLTDRMNRLSDAELLAIVEQGLIEQ